MLSQDNDSKQPNLTSNTSFPSREQTTRRLLQTNGHACIACLPHHSASWLKHERLKTVVRSPGFSEHCLQPTACKIVTWNLAKFLRTCTAVSMKHSFEEGGGGSFSRERRKDTPSFYHVVLKEGENLYHVVLKDSVTVGVWVQNEVLIQRELARMILEK